ncbi:MAG TPA: SIS domain-containing protein [Gaiellaceae bacterium]|jgi:fructoselysine-6-P-deglycase FrlB-like protein|nr:SIS domain-containing protein [Gaiellaceae bacterium]
MAAGSKTRAAIAAQPEWLLAVPTDRVLPEARRAVVLTGCGTSYHAARSVPPVDHTIDGGYRRTWGEQALECVLRPPRADLLVLVSHEGETRLTLEAARAFDGPKWLVTGRAESPIAELCEDVIVATPELEQSYCHTASYTCAVAALGALFGEDVSWLSAAVAGELAAEALPVSEHERWLVAGAGRDFATAQEAALKLREGAQVAAEAHHTEQILHGHLAAVDEKVRCFVLEGEGRAAERAHGLVAALGEIGSETTLVPTRHPVVDIVRFQRLTVDLADARGVDPDLIRRDDPRWQRARDCYE